MKSYLKLLIAKIAGNSIAIKLHDIEKVELAYSFESISNQVPGIVGVLRAEAKLLLLDIAYFFTKEFRSIHSEYRYVILNLEDEYCALVVDEVLTIEDVDSDRIIQLDLLHESGGKAAVYFTQCFINKEGETVFLLDVTALFKEFQSFISTVITN